MALQPLTDTTLNHNNNGPPDHWTIKKSKLGGRGIFATKQIKQGSLIFSNKPLLLGPRGDHARESFCCVCYIIDDACYSCQKCSLLVCSTECEASPKHDAECQFLVDNWKVKPECDMKPTNLMRALVYMRSLILDKEETDLLGVFQKSSTPSKIEEIETLCSNYVIPEDQIKFMETVDSIFKLNAFRVAHNDTEKRLHLRGLYLLSGLLNHSCVPNTRNAFDDKYNMAIYASKDIEMGEEILTCYTGLLWCTAARRCQLQKTKKFWCKCDRCSERTEKGTRLAALKCLNKECVGVLLPNDPLDPISEWTCDNCEVSVTSSKVSSMQSVLGSLVGTLNLDNELRLETLVLERLSLIVPYSNHIFVDLRLRLALKLGFSEGLKLKELSESRLALKESLCRGTLRTVAALGAGDAHLRGLLLYHLHAALAERARRSPQLYEDLKTEIESTIEQASNILQGDISAPPDLELRHRYLGPGCDKPHGERFFILDA